MYPDSEKDRLIKLAEVYQGNTQLNPIQAPAAPQVEKGMAGQMADMAKQKAMQGAVNTGSEALMSGLSQSAAPVVASGVEGGAILGAGTGAGAGAGMAALGTAMPYVGAGLLAGKALGLFSHGGHIGPLSATYADEGYQVPGSTEYNKRMDRNRVEIAQQMPIRGFKNQDQQTRNYWEGLRQLRKQQDFIYPMIVEDYGATMSPNASMPEGVDRMAYTDDPIAQKMYDVGNAPLDTSNAGISANYIGLPIDSQGYTARGYSSGSNGPLSPEYNAEGSFTDNPVIDKLFNEIDQLYREAAQHDAVGDSAMAFDKRDKAEYLQGEFERIKRGMSRLPPENVTYPVEAGDNVITRGMKGLFNIPDYYNNAKQIPTNAAALMNEDPIAMRKYGGISDVEREKSGEL